MKKLVITVLTSASLCLSATSWAAAEDDVLAFIERYASLEGNLDEQEKMIRDDRVQVAPTRWSDNAAYMDWQKRQRAANALANGGPSAFHVDIESPIVRVFGDTAVVSLIRRTLVVPPNGPARSANPLFQTIVLVREDGQWGIAHTHVSPVGPWN